jgi:hypothetical protein
MGMAITRQLRLAVGLVVVGAIVSACASTEAPKLTAGERTIYLAAIEPKGSTTVDKEPFPADPLPPGGGYALKDPDDTGTWTVETYRWLPGEITVVEGDKVTLEILGVNGDSHPTVLEGYDLAFDVKRGQLTNVTFVADKPGIFRFVCSVHTPSMTGTLVVLPAS